MYWIPSVPTQVGEKNSNFGRLCFPKFLSSTRKNAFFAAKGVTRRILRMPNASVTLLLMGEIELRFRFTSMQDVGPGVLKACGERLMRRADIG